LTEALSLDDSVGKEEGEIFLQFEDLRSERELVGDVDFEGDGDALALGLR